MFKPPRGILGDERGRGEGGVGGRWAPLRRALRPAAIVILVVVVLYQYNLLDYITYHPTTLKLSSGPWLRDVRAPGRVVRAPGRQNDVIDTFSSYKQSATCHMSSLEFHDAFEPLCAQPKELLDAMTNGGRAGFDAPFTPRGCDMRWYTTDEICDIMSRFEKIHLLGDSMIRYLTGAIHILLRKDLVTGAYYTWRPQEPEKTEGICECERMFITKCGDNAAVDSAEIWENAPETMACPQETTAHAHFQSIFQYPIDDGFMKAVTDTLPKEKPEKPHAFVLGHGLWGNLNATNTEAWIDEIHARIQEAMPWTNASPADEPPYLFIPPAAAGDGKPAEYLPAQGNENLQRFHHDVKGWIGQTYPSMGFVGLYNATVQGRSPDGTHAGMRGNLIKAMMVFNWLDMISKPKSA